jgi:hypothetical protein
VVGGGAAGLAAAAAAGRAGARVVLLERYGFLGGLATAAHVGTVCGLYLRDTASAEATLVAGGFVKEFASRLQEATGCGPRRLENGLWVSPFSTLAFLRVADAVVSESGNVIVVLHATVTEARAEAARVLQVRALAWSEPLVVRADTVVDCSGEATAAALAGAGAIHGEADQAPALVFVLDNAASDVEGTGFMEMRREVRRAIEKGSLSEGCERFSLVPGPGRDGHITLKLNLSRADSRHPHWQQVTAWEREARARVDELQRFLIENTAACRNARLSSVAPQLGLRSGRRIQGHAILADEDVLGARKLPLGIARGCWPMEGWGNGLRPEMAFFNERDYYEIPLDCLRPVGLDNVLAAGRCLSAAAGAMTSARVIGTALATGWAAGTAAAFQALGRPRNEAIATIRQQLAS